MPHAVRQIRENLPTAIFTILLASTIAFGTPMIRRGQLNTGSIVVVQSEGDYFVIAADSKSLSAKGVSLQRCKVIALDSGLIYANTGYTGNGRLHIGWDASDIARHHFRLLEKTARHELIPKLAEAYGADIAARLRPDVVGHPEEGWPQVLTTSVFAGFDEAHHRVGIEVSIHRTSLGVSYSTKSFPTGDAPFADVIGETEIAQEFAEGRTLRAQSWKTSLALQVTGLGTRERLVAVGEKIVELTTKYQPSVVGGPIDTVVISRTTGVEWVRRKPECAKVMGH